MTATARLFHLDALRAGAMLFGIFVHASTIQKPNLYPLVSGFSDVFRMSVFFLLSGFFTALVCERNTLPAFFRSRMLVLVVPLVAMLIAVVPVTNWLIFSWHNGPIPLIDYLSGGWRLPSRGNDVWHLHLWFLFCLIVYAAITPLLLSLGRRLTGWSGLAAITRHPRLALYLLAAGVGAWFVFARIINQVALEPVVGEGPFGFIARSTAQYFILFAIGVLAYQSRDIYKVLHRFDAPLLVGLGLLYLLIGRYGEAWPAAIERAVFFMVKGALALAITAALMRLTERLITASSGLLTFLVQASYTFYLFHMTFIFVIATLIGRATFDLHLTYWIVIALGLPLTLLFHRYVIGPTPALSLLFNGKTQGKAAARQGAAG